MPFGYSILGGISNSTSALGAASSSTIDRAKAAEQLHNAMLARLTPDTIKVDSVVRDVRDDAAGLEMDYIHQELGILGVDLPMMLDPTNPDHAIVLATRRDIMDTRDRLDALLQQRSEQRRWDKVQADMSFGESLARGLNNLKIPDIPPILGGSLALIAVAVIALFLLMRK